MLDKCILTSNKKMPSEVAATILEGLSNRYITRSNRFYRTIQVGYVGTQKGGAHLISVGLEPSIPTISPLRIEVNPSRFKSYQELLSLVENFDQAENLKIKRLDHAVDIPVPLEEVHKSILVTRKSSREKYARGDALTGFYIGTKPEVLNIYSLGLKLKDPGLKDVTRVELRQFEKKVPVETFFDLPALLTLNQFKSLQFWRLKHPSQVPIDKRDKYKSLFNEINQYGAQGAFKRLNRNWNFKRDFGRHFLEPNPAIPDLSQSYQEQLKQFFKEDEIGIKQTGSC